MTTEDRAAREKRQRRRLTFDTIAESYEAARPLYPVQLIDRLAAEAQLRRGSLVLEVGCGTGQLTRRLDGRGLDVVAIDPGRSLVAAARQHVSADVMFEVTTFEAYEPDRRFDLIVSAAAYHWVDPEVRWAKAASLLGDGAHFGIVDSVTKYGDGVDQLLVDLWIEHSDGGLARNWQPTRTLEEEMVASGFFEQPVVHEHTEPTEMTVDAVVALTCTAGAFLTYSPDVQEAFVSKLVEGLGDRTTVPVVRGGSFALAARR